MPNCYATFPGVTAGDFVSFSGSVSLDAQPGRFTLVCDLSATPQATGELFFTDGVRSVSIPDCRVADLSTGRTSYTLTIEDRRWRWRYGGIYGKYNEPRENFDGVKYEKTPRELADLLWAEMQETNLDSLLLPNSARPAVDWGGDNVADELIALLAQLGCVLAPQLDGGWKVFPLGSGDVYTAAASLTSADLSQSFSTYPDQIAVVFGPIQYEAVFALEAVGEETDGRIVPIGDLSYEPAGGWELEPDTFPSLENDTYVRDGKTLNTQDLARSCVRRLYRIASMPAGAGAFSLNPPGYPATLPPIQELDQLLPLSPEINETYDSMGDPNFGERKPAEVWGEFVKDDKGVAAGLVTRPGTRVPFNFSIDAKRGIVRFSQPVWKHPGDFSQRDPATLFLRCVVEARQPELNVPAFYARYWGTGLDNDTGAEVIERDETTLNWRPVWNADGTTPALGEGEEHPNNRAELDAEAEYYADAKLAGYVTQTGGTLTFDGIHAPNLNGRQTSVSWLFGKDQAPTTTIGVGTRANPYVPDFKYVQAEKLTKSQRLAKERRERLRARKLYRGKP